MAETLYIELGEPEELQLKFPNGLEVDGRYGPQKMFTVLRNGEERRIYLPLATGELIDEFRLGPGERFQLEKRVKKDGRKKGIEWVVTRVDPPQQLPTPREREVRSRAPIAAAALEVSVPEVNNQQNGSNASHANANILADFLVNQTTIITGILCASVDSLRNAERYAASKGFKLEFNEEDVRTLAATLYITAAKNGGAQWQR